MFLGEHQHKLDAKGRVSLPARFKLAPGTAVVLSKHFDKCLTVYRSEDFAEMLGRVAGGMDLSKNLRELRRYYTANALEMELDSAGRISVPQGYREHAGLDKDIAVIGNGDRIEIWDAEAWSSYNDRVAPNIEAMAEELSAGGLF